MTAPVSDSTSVPAVGVRYLLLPIVCAMTLFVSAVLLFTIQPLFARQVLPLLGGAPAVWNTCMVFYQAVLLAGYAFAHFSTTALGSRRQMPLQLALIVLPLFVLPIALPPGWLPPVASNPIPWLLALLAVSVALPFAVISTTAPVIQRWFADSGHPDSGDPYFLYTASNAGSLLGLLAYPLLLEPNLTRSEQAQLWTWGYGLLVVLVVICGMLRRSFDDQQAARPRDTSAAPGLRRGLHWLVLAMVPASLLLAVTTHITTDVAAIPLLWILPLVLYLLSFILVFTRFAAALHVWVVRLMPLAVLVLVYQMVLRLRPPLVAEIELHLAVFFLIAMVCHGELAQLRPAGSHLTGYYLWMSLGGVVGALCTALVAPMVFQRTLEYPLALAAACLVRPALRPPRSARMGLVLDILLPILLGVMTAGISWALRTNDLEMDVLGRERVDLAPWVLWLWAMGLPVGIVFAFVGRPLRFGLSVAAVLLAAIWSADVRDRVEYRERGFFGQLSVQLDSSGEYRWLLHGTTLHGLQSLRPEMRDEALAYFHRTGPVGQVFAAARRWPQPPRRIGVTGLGIGSMAAYAEPGQEWTFYEIDPAVKRVAEDPRYFTYLTDARQRGVALDVVLGDGRLRLADAPEGYFDLLFLDAFSSDAVPVHLLSYEALELYLSRLSERGLLIFNVSNRYLDLEWVLANQARKAGLRAYVQFDTDLDGSDKKGKAASKFVVLCRKEAFFDTAGDSRWRPLRDKPDVGLWTDDYCNLLAIFRWTSRKE